MANEAKVAHRTISDLRREFSTRDKNVLEDGYRQIGVAIQLFPTALILFSLIVSLSTIVISIVFYVYAWLYMCENIHFRNFLGILGLLAFSIFLIMIIVLSVYSFSELKKLKKKHKQVRLFREREEYRSLDEVKIND